MLHRRKHGDRVGALIQGPVWIERNCRIGHGATLRDNVIIGDDCVVGHTVEVKNSILFNGCEVPHFNYVGDSVLGYRVHLAPSQSCRTTDYFMAMNVRLANQKWTLAWPSWGHDRRRTGLAATR